jgi:hypothetical protein
MTLKYKQLDFLRAMQKKIENIAVLRNLDEILENTNKDIDLFGSLSACLTCSLFVRDYFSEHLVDVSYGLVCINVEVISIEDATDRLDIDIFFQLGTRYSVFKPDSFLGSVPISITWADISTENYITVEGKVKKLDLESELLALEAQNVKFIKLKRKLRLFELRKTSVIYIHKNWTPAYVIFRYFLRYILGFGSLVRRFRL